MTEKIVAWMLSFHYDARPDDVDPWRNREIRLLMIAPDVYLSVGTKQGMESSQMLSVRGCFPLPSAFMAKMTP